MSFIKKCVAPFFGGMVEAIALWIKNGCNYRQGVALYELYGNNAFQKAVFKTRETTLNRQKLNELLVALRDSNVKASTPIKLVLPQAKPIAGTQKNNTPQAEQIKKPPTELMQLVDERKRTFAELKALHPLLTTTPAGDALKEIAHRIVRLAKLNVAQWDRYNYLTENGEELPPEPPKPVMVDLNLLTERENLRKAINKAKKRLKAQDKPNKKTQQLIDAKTQQLKDLDIKITQLKQDHK